VIGGFKMIACARFTAVLVGALLLVAPGILFADSADTLPKGVFNAEVTSYLGFVGPPTFTFSGLGSPGTKQLSAGKLGLLENAGQGLNASDPTSPNGTLGAVDLLYSISGYVLAPSLYYGITDWFTVGFTWPIYLQASTHIDRLWVGTGNLGYNSRYPQNPAHNQPIVAADNPYAVTGTPGALRLATEYFEYEPVEDWQKSGPGDLYLGARARLFHNRWLRLSSQLVVTLPTGASDDPDNLVDWGLGDGQTDLGVGLLVDFIRVRRLNVNLQASYTGQLPDKETMRVYPWPDFPFAPKTEKTGLYRALGHEAEVNRDLGDVIFVGGSAEYLLMDWLLVGAGYSLTYRLADGYHAVDSGQDLAALAEGTSYHVHTISGRLGVSAVELFRQQRFKVPFYAQVIVGKSFSDSDDHATLSTAIQLGLFVK
jgi:hypothetical protein